MNESRVYLGKPNESSQILNESQVLTGGLGHKVYHEKFSRPNIILAALFLFDCSFAQKCLDIV